MDSLSKQPLQHLSKEGLSKISSQIGTDEQTAKSALSTAMPLLVSALARNASQPQGASALQQALTKDHDGSVLSDLQGYLKNPQTDDGAGILGHVLGNQQSTVTQGLEKTTKLDSGQIVKLLQIAAPLVMGLLGKQQRQQGLDANALSSFLGNQRQQAQESNPDMMGMLNTLLDADKDGSALDDILGAAGNFLGNE